MIAIKHITDNRIAVVSPYNTWFISLAKRSAGRWSASDGAWVFPAETIETVRATLRKVYGEDDTPAPRVRLRVKYDGGIDEGGVGTVVVGGRQVARAFHRDSGARLGEDIVVISGGFGSGGSRKNWRVTVNENTVFDVLRLPEPIARRLVDRHPDQFAIVADDGSAIGEDSPDNVVQLRGA